MKKLPSEFGDRYRQTFFCIRWGKDGSLSGILRFH